MTIAAYSDTIHYMRNLRKLLLSPKPGDKLRELHKNGELADWIPALSALDINDQHSHRHKNNFYHSVIVLEQAIKLETKPDIILRTAALFHDIGKVETRRIPKKGPVSFLQHEAVGARQVKSILRKNNYRFHEIEMISELIANHMRSYGFDEAKWTDAAIRRLVKDISSESQLKRLYKIFKADVSTKHDHKRAKVYSKVDALEKRVNDVIQADKLAARRPAINGNDLIEIFDLKPGKKLGEIMKFLNTEEGLALSREEAIVAVKLKLSN